MFFAPFIRQKVRIIDRYVLPAQAAPALNQIHHFMYVTSQILMYCNVRQWCVLYYCSSTWHMSMYASRIPFLLVISCVYDIV